MKILFHVFKYKLKLVHDVFLKVTLVENGIAVSVLEVHRSDMRNIQYSSYILGNKLYLPIHPYPSTTSVINKCIVYHNLFFLIPENDQKGCLRKTFDDIDEDLA